MIGVDISSSAVKMLELGAGGDGSYRVERYAIARLPREAVTEGNLTKPEAVEVAMREAWQALDTRTRDIVLALPASAVTAKKLILPKEATDADLEAQAISEATQVVPFPMEEITLDFQVLGPSERNPNDNEVLVVITRKDRVDERVAVAESAGLKTTVMDVDTYATLSAFDQIAFQLPNGGKGQTVAILDIGHTTTHINILHDNKPVYQREHPFGGQILTQEISRRFGLPWEEAEDAKCKGLLPESFESEVLRPFLDSAAQEISRALQLFFASSPQQQVDHLLLAGGCSSVPGLDEAIFGKTQISTVITNPFAKMAVSNHVKARQLAVDAPALFVACGLALRRFDPA
ncbi:pilus assembly protein PilM [Parasulfuritortus cantonensis]|uniref:pilus assembly protein PilM n=1 Tax=Parasulfuritortus cantonensis TaxID=2528202 RepID=UPI0030B85DC7